MGRLVDQCPRIYPPEKNSYLEDVAGKLIDLFPFDAIRTYGGACARIELGNGSQLYAAEQLIVLNPDLLEGTHRRQRAIVRAGQVSGETNGEMWILTSAAILKLIAKKNGENAKVTLTVNEGKDVKIELHNGEGEFLRVKKENDEKTPERVALVPEQPMILEAPEVAGVPEVPGVPAADQKIEVVDDKMQVVDEEPENVWNQGPVVQMKASVRLSSSPSPSQVKFTFRFKFRFRFGITSESSSSPAAMPTPVPVKRQRRGAGRCRIGRLRRRPRRRPRRPHRPVFFCMIPTIISSLDRRRLRSVAARRLREES